MTIHAHDNNIPCNEISTGNHSIITEENHLPPVSIHSSNRLMPGKTKMTGLHTAKVAPSDGTHSPVPPSYAGSRRASMSTKHISPTAHDILLDRFQVQKKEDGLTVKGITVTANCHVIVVLFGSLFIVAGLVFSIIAFRNQDPGAPESARVTKMLEMLKVAGPILIIFGSALLVFGCFLCALGWKLRQAERMQEYSFRFPLHLQLDPSLGCYGEKFGEALTPLEGSFFLTPAGSRRASINPAAMESWYNSPAMIERRKSLNIPNRKVSLVGDPPILPTRRASINPVPTAFWSRPATPSSLGADEEKGNGRPSSSHWSDNISEGSFLDLGAYDLWTEQESCYSIISSHPDAYFGSDQFLTPSHDVASFPDRPNSNWGRILGSIRKTTVVANKFREGTKAKKDNITVPDITVTSESPRPEHSDRSQSPTPAFKITKMSSAVMKAVNENDKKKNKKDHESTEQDATNKKL